MAVDKKVVDGVSRLVLLDGLGAAAVRDDVPPTLLGETLDAGAALCGGGGTLP